VRFRRKLLERARVVSGALAAPVLAAFIAARAGAQPRDASASKANAATRVNAAPQRTAPAADGGASPGPGASPGASFSADAGVVESKTLDGGTRIFKFSELDIEGRLKSPQLVYFLRRVRAEFAAGELGHRSFLREMSETRRESSF
jgi:hypothetical protein